MFHLLGRVVRHSNCALYEYRSKDLGAIPCVQAGLPPLLGPWAHLATWPGRPLPPAAGRAWQPWEWGLYRLCYTSPPMPPPSFGRSLPPVQTTRVWGRPHAAGDRGPRGNVHLGLIEPEPAVPLFIFPCGLSQLPQGSNEGKLWFYCVDKLRAKQCGGVVPRVYAEQLSTCNRILFPPPQEFFFFGSA